MADSGGKKYIPNDLLIYYHDKRRLERLVMTATIGDSPRTLTRNELILFLIVIIVPIILFILIPEIINLIMIYDNIFTIIIFYVVYFNFIYILISVLQKNAIGKIKRLIKIEKEEQIQIIPDDLKKYLPKRYFNYPI